MLPIGQRLMTASVELDEFGAKESQMAEKSADPQTLRYWVALQGRSDTVSEKVGNFYHFLSHVHKTDRPSLL